jgi:hypothetical protein
MDIEQCDVGVWPKLMLLGIECVGKLWCTHRNEPSVSTECLSASQVGLCCSEWVCSALVETKSRHEMLDIVSRREFIPGYWILYIWILCNYLSIYLWFNSSCEPWALFQFLNLYTVGMTPWTGDQHVSRPLPTHRTETQNKRTQTFMPWVGFEPTIAAFERAKRVQALEHATTVIGCIM